jgi:dienelactone hydrolase
VSATLFAAGALVGCSGPAEPAATVVPLPTALPAAIPYDDAMRLFEYDRSLPYAVKELRVTDEAGAKVEQFTYSLASGTRTLAYFVFPRGSGPFGAVMFLPGGQRGPEEFMDEALDLASHGIASLLIKEPELNPMPLTDADAVTSIIFEMRELRRALDLLASRPEVDPQRLGVVGVSFGAVRAGTFAGIEGRRLRIAVLASTPASYDYAPMAPFDPVVWAPHVSPAALYVQEGTQDTWFSHDEAESLIAAAREPKKLVWYPADHGLNGDAYNDRQGWLIAALGPR